MFNFLKKIFTTKSTRYVVISPSKIDAIEGKFVIELFEDDEKINDIGLAYYYSSQFDSVGIIGNNNPKSRALSFENYLKKNLLLSALVLKNFIYEGLKYDLYA
jgi:hypothetical protein